MGDWFFAGITIAVVAELSGGGAVGAPTESVKSDVKLSVGFRLRLVGMPS